MGGGTVDAVVIGAGLRGMFSYGMRATEAGVRFVAVVDPSAERRQAFGAMHDLGLDRQFATVEDWLAAPGAPFASAAIVATPDDQHVAPTLAALGAGCHVLLEKPMAQSLAACRQLIAAADAADRQLHVCHVMRYSPVFRTIERIVSSGRLGRIVTIDHRENVNALHMAHSYVRGAYRRADASNPMLLAKSCHDLDLLHWLLGDDPIRRVASFGSLLHFRRESVGPEIPERCTDGCPIEASCPFSAIRAYAPDEPRSAPEIALLTQMFPISEPVSFDPAERRVALETSPFGRCVYRCDNDVVDHQVVAMETASGTSIAFTMHGHSHAEGRTMRIDGTVATLRATITEADPEVTVSVHGSDEVEVVDLGDDARSSLGHSGGDLGVLRAFAASLSGTAAPGEGLSTDARTSYESHLIGWAAERARATGTVVEVESLR
jgi:predicted dehydrogenase